jgi:tetraacyldisaccharide 4'-kinase
LLEVTPDTGARDCGDEPALLARRTGAPVVVALDRVAAARALLQRHADVDVLVSDDGLQHLRLARQAQVLVFDERGVGNGWVLPSGPLREPLPRAVPPRTLVVYNAPQPSTPLTGTLARRTLAGVARLADWWRGAPAHPAALLALRGRTVRAVAGVAAPERFFQMLRAQGLSIDALGLPDHCDYAVLPWPDDGAEVVVTEKDAIKLDPARAGTSRVWVAPLDFALDAAFDAALLELLPPPGTRHGNTTA